MDCDHKESEYIEASWPEFGVEHRWKNAKVLTSLTTERGTIVEMVQRPQWGMACYMNGEIQSCTVDEKMYHEALVHPAMISTNNPRRVLIVGGGEGATAREVLKWESVERVDMYEWDQEVVELFRTSYPEWGNGIWNDPRLYIHYNNFFETVRQVPLERYDVIIIDLFEPSYLDDMEEENNMWMLFHRLALEWLTEDGSITMYSGIRNHFRDIHPNEQLIHPTVYRYLTNNHYLINNIFAQLQTKELTPYKVFIPSYSGEAMFLLLKHSNIIQRWNQLGRVNDQGISSHLGRDIWNSYKIWNEYH